MSNPERKTNAQLVDTINQLKAQSRATPDLQFGEMCGLAPFKESQELGTTQPEPCEPLRPRGCHHPRSRQAARLR